MVFDSIVNNVEGIIYQVPVNMVVSKLAKSRWQESINIRKLSKIISVSEVVVSKSEGSVIMVELLDTFSWAGDLGSDG